MASALQRQLAQIAATSTHQYDLKAQKSAHGKSLLFEPKVAASQSFEDVYLLCYEGYRDLCALDSRFLQFSKSLFSEQSKVEDRAQMTKEENKKLDHVLEAFITLVGPKLLLKPAQKAVEWLVRRFRVHEENTECLTLTYLPYHNTPQFLALLSILPPHPPRSIRFLAPYIQSPTNPPRRTIVYSAVNTPATFDALQAYTAKVVQAGHHASQAISFWCSITAEAVFGMLESTSSGRRGIQAQKMEEIVLRVLPVLNTCMHSKYGAETVAACYAIVTVLVGKAELGDKMLDSLMEAVALAHDQETLNACLQCLAVVAEQRSPAQLPARVQKKLLAVPNIAQRLSVVSKQCRVTRLALGCALGALSKVGRSDEQQAIFQDLLASGLVVESHTRNALSALVTLIKDCAPGSGERVQLLEMAGALAETPSFLDAMRGAAKSNNIDLESLGLPEAITEPTQPLEADSDDEMLDVDDDASVPKVECPKISVKTFLIADAFSDFTEVADAFEKSLAAGTGKRARAGQFLRSDRLLQKDSMQKALYLTFLARVWCSARLTTARVAALRAATATIKESERASDLQNLVPYLISALADPSPLVRRAAAACITTASSKPSSAKASVWGSSDIYGKASSNIIVLKTEDVSNLLTSVLVPVLEESIMDANFAVTAIKDVIEGSHKSKDHSKHGLKLQTRIALLSYLASHTSLTPLLRVRRTLLPIFKFTGKTSDAVRSNAILPTVRQWCEHSPEDVSKACEAEGIILQDVERAHLSTLVAKEAKSVELLTDIVSGATGKKRTDLVNAAFDQVIAFWPKMKPEPRSPLAHTLLQLSFNESVEAADKLRKERAIETLRTVTLDSATLVALLESVPSAMTMPEGPPAKKRRRTSRNEMARIELSSQDEVQSLLRKLTLVLELIEGSKPGEHPLLFRSLFNVFGELQPLRQQSGSELVYLQSIILSSLSPIVDTLKVSGSPLFIEHAANIMQEQADTAEYESAVRADLLIDCIRHSTSSQVQNGALLLIANLASWVPELILHNLMPIFTFIGSTLLRQQDDYSAQVVDKVRLPLFRNVARLTLSRQSHVWYHSWLRPSAPSTRTSSLAFLICCSASLQHSSIYHCIAV